MSGSGELWEDRYWQDFPLLRGALGGRMDPPRSFEIRRLSGIAEAAFTLQAEVWKAANPYGKDGFHTALSADARQTFHKEIDRLAFKLEDLEHMLVDFRYQLRELHSVIERPDSP